MPTVACLGGMLAVWEVTEGFEISERVGETDLEEQTTRLECEKKDVKCGKVWGERDTYSPSCGWISFTRGPSQASVKVFMAMFSHSALSHTSLYSYSKVFGEFLNNFREQSYWTL